MTSCIPLAKGYDSKKLSFPVYVSEKLDGVPVRIDVTINGSQPPELLVRSRQGKPVPSVMTQAYVLAYNTAIAFGEGQYTYVAEVTHPDLTNFKDTSGAVRTQVQNDNLVLNIFDFDLPPYKCSFVYRMEILLDKFSAICNESIKIIPQHFIEDAMNLDHFIREYNAMYPNVEGWIVRSHDAEFKPGARHWDYQKVVSDPTADLLITGFTEAIDKYGDPKGMVGGLDARYKNTVIGVGPGKLTHKERIELWNLFVAGKFTPRLAKVQYKRDPSYTALRQPTFQHWRTDKDEVSYE